MIKKTAINLILAITLVQGCTPIRFSIPKWGTVSDKSTGRPINAAIVEDVIVASHGTLAGTVHNDLDTIDKLADDSGHFSIGPGVYGDTLDIPPLSFPGGIYHHFSAIAPGYYLYQSGEISDYETDIDIQLTKSPYYLPIHYYGKGYASPHYGYFKLKDPKKFMTGFSFKERSPLGVIVNQEGANFDYIFSNNKNIFITDTIHSKNYKFSGDGPLQETNDQIDKSIIITNTINSMRKHINVVKEQINHQNNNSTPEEKITTSDLANRINQIPDQDIICITSNRNYKYIFITKGEYKHIVYLIDDNTIAEKYIGKHKLITGFPPQINSSPATVASTRMAKAAPMSNNIGIGIGGVGGGAAFGQSSLVVKEEIRIEPEKAEINSVRTCQATDMKNDLFVGFENEGIRKYQLPIKLSRNPLNSYLAEASFWDKSEAALATEDGKHKTIVSLGVGELYLGGHAHAWWHPAVYAVSNDSHLYRFAPDGTPDMMIDF